jgi:hypothetical protein
VERGTTVVFALALCYTDLGTEMGNPLDLAGILDLSALAAFLKFWRSITIHLRKLKYIGSPIYVCSPFFPLWKKARPGYRSDPCNHKLLLDWDGTGNATVIPYGHIAILQRSLQFAHFGDFESSAKETSA